MALEILSDVCLVIVQSSVSVFVFFLLSYSRFSVCPLFSSDDSSSFRVHTWEGILSWVSFDGTFFSIVECIIAKNSSQMMSTVS